jgi:ATP-dependent Clp protease protease subunit
MTVIPYVTEKTHMWVKTSDIFSRLLEDRVVFFTWEVNSQMAQSIIAQLLYLESKDPNKDIIMYVDSPGGHVTAGLAVYDTMQYIKCDVVTIWLWLAASMWSIILTAWTKWKRFILPHGEVMIHQPLGGAEWQATDIAIQAQHILRTKDRLNKILAKHTWQPLEKIEKDVERDNWFTAEEAVEYGLVDAILEKRE